MELAHSTLRTSTAVGAAADGSCRPGIWPPQGRWADLRSHVAAVVLVVVAVAGSPRIAQGERLHQDNTPPRVRIIIAFIVDLGVPFSRRILRRHYA